MANKIGFFIGSRYPFNIQNIVRNIGKMLAEEFETDLVTTAGNKLDRDITNYFNVFTSGQSNIFGEYSCLKKYVDKESPDVVVQLTYPPVHGSITGIIAKQSNVQFVYRYSGDRFQASFVRRGKDKWTHYAFNNILGFLPLVLADKYIVLGSCGKRRLINRGVDAKNIQVLPPVVDHNRFKLTDSEPEVSNIPSDNYIALFVGRRNYLKGMETLNRTIPRILDRRQDIQFVFIGEGDQKPNIPSRYEDNITLVGPVPPASMPEYYNIADFLIHPSLTEGAPLVLLESLASGTPVIGRAVGEIPDITTNVFHTDNEFVELVCNFEDLVVEEAGRYYLSNAEAKYVNFFNSIC